MSAKKKGAEPDAVPDADSQDEPAFRGGLRCSVPGEVKTRRLPDGFLEYIMPEQCSIHSGVYPGPVARRLPDGTIEYIPGDE